jgi:glycosyltransferase involved in cell wall biosynthesis
MPGPKLLDLLFIDHCPECNGGAQISLLLLFQALLDAGVSANCIMPGRSKLLPIRNQEFPIIRMIFNAVYIRLIVLKRKPKFIYCNSLRDRIMCCLCPQSRVLTHLRDVPVPAHKKVFAILPSRSVIVSSSYMEDSASKLGISSILVPNIVLFSGSQKELTTAKRKETTGKESRPIRAIMVSNYVPWKKHPLAIEAVSILRQKGMDITLDIWGDDILGENRKYTETVRFAAGKSSGAVALIQGRRLEDSEFAQYDFLLHCAENEPFGRVIVEALGNGCPCVVHDSGEPPRLVRRFQGGTIFALATPEAICAAVTSLIESYASIKTQLALRLSEIQQEFSSENSLRSLQRLGILSVPHTIPSETLRDIAPAPTA